MDIPERDVERSSWRTAAPVAAGIGGIVFLAISARVGYRLRVTRLAKEVAAEVHKSSDTAQTTAAAMQLKSMDARKLAAQALVRGSLAAALGFGAFGGAVAVYLNTYTLESFARKMEQVMPKFRKSLEDILGTPLDTMKQSGQSAVRLVVSQPTSAPADAAAEEQQLQAWVEKMLLSEAVASDTSIDTWLSAQERGIQGPPSEPTTPLQ